MNLAASNRQTCDPSGGVLRHAAPLPHLCPSHTHPCLAPACAGPRRALPVHEADLHRRHARRIRAPHVWPCARRRRGLLLPHALCHGDRRGGHQAHQGKHRPCRSCSRQAQHFAEAVGAGIMGRQDPPAASPCHPAPASVLSCRPRCLSSLCWTRWMCRGSATTSPSQTTTPASSSSTPPPRPPTPRAAATAPRRWAGGGVAPELRGRGVRMPLGASAEQDLAMPPAYRCLPACLPAGGVDGRWVQLRRGARQARDPHEGRAGGHKGVQWLGLPSALPCHYSLARHTHALLAPSPRLAPTCCRRSRRPLAPCPPAPPPPASTCRSRWMRSGPGCWPALCPSATSWTPWPASATAPPLTSTPSSPPCSARACW